tara:strand:+ start:17301 stop:18578 length:1278 start_codon:yes stop_codon:yes gene_type:complete
MRKLSLTSVAANQFIRDFAKLSIGSFVGKMIPFLAMPFLTRLYTPEHFGLLASYLAIVTTLAVVASLRLDVAIPLVADEDEAANLLLLSVLITLALTAVLIVIAAILYIAVPPLDLPVLDFVWLVPIGFLIAGLYSPLKFWSTRARRFNEISWTRISQAIIGTSVSLLSGAFGYVPIGLLVGNVLNIGSGSLRLGRSALSNDRRRLSAVNVTTIKKAFRANIKYPKFSAPGALFNIAGVQMPIALIATNNVEAAGFVFITMQIMFAPLKIIGAPLSQTFMSRGPEKFKDGTLQSFTFRVMRNSAVSFALPLIGVGLLLYLFAAPVFGAEWNKVGVLAIWMLPWAITQSITSPISPIAYMVGWQDRLLLFRFLSFVLRCGGTGLAMFILAEDLVPVAYCLLNFVTYGIMLIFFVCAAASTRPKVAQ